MSATSIPSRLVMAGLALSLGCVGPSSCFAEIALSSDIPIVSPRFGAPPAPSAITVRLLAVALPTLDALERSSAMAVDRATPRLRTSARRAVIADRIVADALAPFAAPAAVGPDPLDVAAAQSAQVGAAADTILANLPRLLQTSGSRAVAADAAIAAAGASDLAVLGGLTGQAFDETYDAMQRENLSRLLSVFRDYVQNGDDPTLRAIAVHALPKIKARLAAMQRS